MATRLEDIRSRAADIATEKRVELKDKTDKVFKPNVFAELIDDGLRIWTEDGQGIVLPDASLADLKKRLTYLLATA
jgi:hypothetical protein